MEELIDINKDNMEEIATKISKQIKNISQLRNKCNWMILLGLYLKEKEYEKKPDEWFGIKIDPLVKEFEISGSKDVRIKDLERFGFVKRHKLPTITTDSRLVFYKIGKKGKQVVESFLKGVDMFELISDRSITSGELHEIATKLHDYNILILVINITNYYNEIAEERGNKQLLTLCFLKIIILEL